MTPINWLTAISICFLPIGSCMPTGNADFPSKVSFPASGDEKQINGTGRFYRLSFEEKDIPSDFSYSDSDSSMMLSAEWIEVTGKVDGNMLNIHVEPNLTGKPRSITLEISGGLVFPNVKIEQSK